MLQGLTVLERGWLSSNNIVVHAARGEGGATLIDSGHVTHAEQTVQLVRHALAGQALARLVNTHLHSDHCGGNAGLTAAFGMPTTIPPGQADAVRAWDDEQLSYRASGQHIARFTFDDTLAPGDTLVAGGREWQVLAAPGHDPHSVIFFDARHGVLISADALWENGFGVVFPEVLGEPAFEDVGVVLERIAALPVRVVIPGHGAPFSDAAGALERARRRLAVFRAEPSKHLRHAAKVSIKYHLMEERTMPRAALRSWAAATPLMRAVWDREQPRGFAAIEAWIDALIEDLARSGALAIDGERLRDC
jgi:glyoxylase-like metal-dependent hydrolase (beta-lactamase superfamily II)